MGIVFQTIPLSLLQILLISKFHLDKGSSISEITNLEIESWSQKATLPAIIGATTRCRISKRRIEMPSSEIPVLPHLFAFACTILISRWFFSPACKCWFCARAHRVTKKAKSSKKWWRARLRIDLKYLTQKFIEKLIMFAGKI